MNTLAQITLTQFRNYAQQSFAFSTPVTCITGPNGSGKTNLLDAVYYLCYTKSYFSGQLQNSVQMGTDGFRLEGRFQKTDSNETVICKWKAGIKEITVNDVPAERITDYIGSYASVMIAPDDMELINGSSELRRRWIDAILGQTDKEYLERLLQYQRILLQRRAWLRMQAFNASAEGHLLDFYNNQLSLHGEYLHRQRQTFVAEFIPLLQSFYHQLSGGKEAIALIYQSDLLDASLHRLLTESLQNDVRLQRTTKGPHRDDLLLLLEEKPIRQFGSQGQKKSFLFAMKLAQYTYLADKQGHFPILLLDDVFEKLDQHRMEALLRIIRGPAFGQVILTDTHAPRVLEAFGSSEEISFIEL